jgi:integrase
MAKRKKSANGAGSVEFRSGLWWTRVALPGTKPLRRKRLPLAGSEKMTQLQAAKAGAKLSADVRAGRYVIDEKPRRKGTVPFVSAIMTVRQLGEKWTSGELFDTYGNVNRLRVKATAAIDAWMLKAHAYEVKARGPSGPTFGDLPVTAVTTDDVSAVMAAHPRELRAKTRGDTYQRLRRLFDLAIFPLRLRKDDSNPVTRYLRPERDPEKLFCFLYPTEALALLRGTDAGGKVVVPLGRRVLYALATYTGQRKGSLYALRWKHVDVQHGTIASFKTKTGRAQYFVADSGLMDLLQAWRALRGAPADDDPIVADADVAYDRKRLATALRDDLRAVGVTRALLFEEDAPNVEALRFHDLRSTFCTWARRAGKSDAWISERTGHELSGDMINRYDRGATTLEDLAYAPFPAIGRAVPELAAMSDAMAITGDLLARLAQPLAKTALLEPANDSEPEEESIAMTGTYDIVGARGFEPPTPRSRSNAERDDGTQGRVSTSDDVSASSPDDARRAQLANGVGQQIDSAEASLARALDGAVAAGRWDVVAQLAAELQARRQRS